MIIEELDDKTLKPIKSAKLPQQPTYYQQANQHLRVFVKGLALAALGVGSYVMLRWALSNDTDSEQENDLTNNSLNQASVALMPVLAQGLKASLDLAVVMAGAMSYRYLDKLQHIGILTGMAAMQFPVYAYAQETDTVYFKGYTGVNGGYTGAYTFADGEGGSIAIGTGGGGYPEILSLDSAGKINSIHTINGFAKNSKILGGCRMADNGMIVSLGSGGGATLLYTSIIKLDNNMNIQWAKTGPSGNSGFSYCSPDNTVIYSGMNSLTSTTYDVTAKIDGNNGNLLWANKYTPYITSSAASNYLAGPRLVAVSSNNEIVISGAIDDNSISFFTNFFHTRKLDGNGNVLWENTWGQPPTQVSVGSIANSVAFTKDGGILLGAGTSAFTGGGNSGSAVPVVFKFDSTGKNLVFANVQDSDVGNVLSPLVLEQLDGSIVTIQRSAKAGTPSNNVINFFSAGGNYLSTQVLICPSVFNDMFPTDGYINANGCIVYAAPESGNAQMGQVKLSPSGTIPGCTYSQSYSTPAFQSVTQAPVDITSSVTQQPFPFTLIDVTSSTSITLSAGVATEESFCSATITVIPPGTPTKAPNAKNSTPPVNTIGFQAGVAAGGASAVGIGVYLLWRRMQSGKKDMQSNANQELANVNRGSKEFTK